MTDSEVIIIKKAIADLETGLQFNAPKSFLRIMTWQAKETLLDLIKEKECGK